jgi:orotate phosphoribosyltransferase
MLHKQDVANELAELLLQIKALQVNVQRPFTWASGLRSPVYCDNRVTLSYPAIRKQIRFWLCDLIQAHFPGAEQVAAVATGAIAHGMAVADQLDLPFLYVRPEPKGHGLGKQVEGRLQPVPTVVVEDLISTGKSSLAAVKALRDDGAPVLGLAALFSYEMALAEQGFAREQCTYVSLSNFTTLQDMLVRSGYISAEEKAGLSQWHANPKAWSEAVQV